MTKRGEWWHDFFPVFRPVFGILPQRDTNTQVRYLVKKLRLSRGRSFLDCPCGIGRVSVPMARKGIKVTGVDIIEGYLEELQRKAQRAGLKIATVHTDMRRIDFENQFHAGGNLWTSFGFFEKESDHLLTLKRAHRALKPGGRFVVHTINRDWIIMNFQPRGWMDIGKMKVLEERSFDYGRSIIRSRWHFLEGADEKEFEANIRIWSLHELMELFRQAGFVDVTASSSEKDEPVSRTQRMLYVFGTKPKK